MNRKTRTRLGALLTASMLLLGGCAGTRGEENALLDPENPIEITIWNYYNGAQQETFDRLVREFNETAGKEQGIVAVASSQGSVTDLQTNVLAAAGKKVGAAELPNIFSAYADTAYAVDQLGLAADLAPFFTDEELSAYIDGYIEEGRFSDADSLKIFPIAKATEIFMLNKTDWDVFAAATGAEMDALSTIEGVTAIAAQYYEWTDSLTPDIAGDGRAFFGRDAMANYFLIGAKQLGVELFSRQNGETELQFEEAVVRRLWDNYYVPYVSGHFLANGRFRSDDVKMGTILAVVGSSSGAPFFPDAVIVDDEHQYPIEVAVLPAPQFADGAPVAVQQGAGMVVTAGEERAVYASVQFLKWFTDAARNSVFSIGSGYMPVKKEANEMAFIYQAGGLTDDTADALLEQIVSVAIDTVKRNEMYTTKAFAAGTDARAVLENALFDQAQADREQVVARLAAGMPHGEAVAPYLRDEVFDGWYASTRQELERLIA